MDTNDIEQFTKVIATFAPKRTDDLSKGAKQLVGVRGLWFAAWEIEDGEYEGQMAMTWMGDQPPHRSIWDTIGWAPLCDLSDIEPAPQ
jgi:hypothetical protein